MKSQDFIVPSHVEKYLDDLIFGDKPRRYDLTRVGRYKINKKLSAIFEELKKNSKDFKVPSEDRRTLTKEDIVAAIKYLMNLSRYPESPTISTIWATEESAPWESCLKIR